jgi:hypothetical protein
MAQANTMTTPVTPAQVQEDASSVTVTETYGTNTNLSQQI